MLVDLVSYDDPLQSLLHGRLVLGAQGRDLLDGDPAVDLYLVLSGRSAVLDAAKSLESVAARHRQKTEVGRVRRCKKTVARIDEPRLELHLLIVLFRTRRGGLEAPSPDHFEPAEPLA
eukprot:9489036-Pyramimonas_sp.AAC.1